MLETNRAPRRIQLIANPVAGGDALAKIQQARTCLAEGGDRVELLLTGGMGTPPASPARRKPATSI